MQKWPPRQRLFMVGIAMSMLLLTLLLTRQHTFFQSLVGLAQAAPSSWSDRFGLPGTEGTINTVAVAPNGDLYIGGANLLSVANVSIANIARRDKATGQWSSIGAANDVNAVNTMVISGTTLYIGGDFALIGGISANRIVRYDTVTKQWSAFGSAMGGTRVSAIAVSGNTVYAAGQFTTANGTTVNNIARWNGSIWQPLGSGITGTVSSLALIGNELYVAGLFTNAGGLTVANIARWNTVSEQWSAVGSGTDLSINTLVANGTDLYAGGTFGTAGGVTVNNVARWDTLTQQWSALGSGITPANVQELVFQNGQLYASTSGTTSNPIYRWNGSNWASIATLDVFAHALAFDGSTLIAAGGFTHINGIVADRLASWDGATWLAFNTEMRGLQSFASAGIVNAIATAGNQVYVGGTFNTAGNYTSNQITRWDPTTGDWLPLGAGLTGTTVNALASSGTKLYVAGQFTNAGGVAAANIAAWDTVTQTWSALGSGVNGQVYAVAADDRYIYAGGLFTSAGGNSANRIARYDTQNNQWSALGSGVNNDVRALALSGNTLYVAGRFTTAGGITVNHLARYDLQNNTWSSMGSGTSTNINTLLLNGTDLYVGGDFTSLSGISAVGVARWDSVAQSWSAVGSRPNGVNTLFLGPSGLYAGGSGSPWQYISRWDGVQWVTLESGTNGPVSALGVIGRELYVGGSFTTAGALPAKGFSIYTIPSDPPTMSTVAPQSVLENDQTAAIAVTLSDPDTPINTLTLTASSSNPNLIPNSGITIGGSGANRTITITPQQTDARAAPTRQGQATITLNVSDGISTASQSFVVTVQPPPWLMLLYLNGDDLPPNRASGQVGLSAPIQAATGRLHAMPYNPAMRLVILYDVDTPPEAGLAGDSRIFVRDPGGLTDVTPQLRAGTTAWPGFPSNGELNSGSITTLRNFVTWGHTIYPGSTYTFLSIVDHGGGWAPTFDDPPGQPGGGGRVQAGGWRGMSIDGTSGGSSISTRDTGTALNSIPKSDLLFLDACLMGMIESAYEVRNAADFYVAGQNLLFAGLPYDDYFSPLNLTRSTTPENLARTIVQRYNARMNSATNPFAIAAIDLRLLRSTAQTNPATQVNTLAGLVLDALPAGSGPIPADDPTAAALTDAYTAAQKFDYDNSLTIDSHEGYVDLADFASRLAADARVSSDIRSAAQAVVASVRGLVLQQRSVSGTYEGNPWNFDNANGISIYLPLGEQDYRPTLVDVNNPSRGAQPERQLTFYTDPLQLNFTRDVPQWSALLVRLESSVPIIRAPGGLPTTARNGSQFGSINTASIDERPFNSPYPLQNIMINSPATPTPTVAPKQSFVMLPLIQR